MSSKSLPERPDLADLEREANAVLRLHRDGKASAAARIAANHPGFMHQDSRAVLDSPLSPADARLVIAREYGFDDWATLEHHVGAGKRVAPFAPHPRFGDAVRAIDSGGVDGLRALLDVHPELTHARTNLEPPYHYFTGATLLHHVAWNPGRDAPVPPNVVEIARFLLDRGSDPDALTLGYSIGTTMGLILTSMAASDANASGPLIDLLLERGASIDLRDSAAVIPDWGSRNVVHLALANHAPRAAEKLIELGATADVCVAAALGRMDLVRRFFSPDGRLMERPRQAGNVLSEPDAIGLALLFAYVYDRQDVLDFLLEKDGNWNVTGVNNGTVLHRAAWDGNLGMVKRLVAKGADITNRENPFTATPFSWAQHNRQHEVVEWMRRHCPIDIHDAVGFNLREQAEARLREDPGSVNRRIDQWEAPQSTPLYWAAWTQITDVTGAHSWPESDRESLAAMLLDYGADPNIVAGDGRTALDVAKAADAPSVAKLIESHGGKSSAEL
jgi:ankyrin repeat protein